MRRRLMTMLPTLKVNLDNYLTISPIQTGFKFSFSSQLEYTYNGRSWQTLEAETELAVDNGESIYLRANLYSIEGTGIGIFTMNGKKCNLSGNCMSLLYGDAAADNTSVPSYAFLDLFKDCTSVSNVASGFLPATTLNERCYYNMFYGCTNLKTAPTLPALSVPSSAYMYMFAYCSSLAAAPELPATQVGTYCYCDMFYRCTNLKKAPSKLPAKTLATSCYYAMFYGCTVLQTAPTIEALTLTTSSLSYMFNNCTSLTYIKAMFTTAPSSTNALSWVYKVAESGTFVKNKNATWTNTFGTSGIPTGWTVVTE